jgi:UDP-glucose:(heptosyl)LPS alpha-1,3-glucosyltransferase
MKPDARKKIAVVIPKYGSLGGAESHTAELTNRIARNEQYDVHVFANQWTNHSENITFHKVPIISFPKFLTTISFAYFAGIRISPINFDIIHTHERIFSADICTLHGLPHST